MKRALWMDGGAALVLVGLGVAVRLGCEAMPNVAPMAALALFAGFFLARAWLALAVPLAVLTLSDLVIGGYDLPVMLAVYAALALPVLLRPLLRRGVRLDDAAPAAAARSVFCLAGCTLAGSLAYFLVTNFAVWAIWYEPSLAGLTACYAAALPFFRYTVAGDAFFAFALFGALAAATQLGWVRAARPALAEAR